MCASARDALLYISDISSKESFRNISGRYDNEASHAVEERHIRIYIHVRVAGEDEEGKEIDRAAGTVT